MNNKYLIFINMKMNLFIKIFHGDWKKKMKLRITEKIQAMIVV